MYSYNEYFISIAILIITYTIYRFYWKSGVIKCVMHQNIDCKIATTWKECIELINELNSFKPKAVGFDIEWSSKKGDENKKVSLIQLAHKELIILIRMNLIKTIPIELHGLLSNVEILKVGIGIFGDKIKLKNDYDLDVNGCIDINHIFNNKLSIQHQNKLKAKYYQKNVDDLSKDELNNSLSLKSMSMILLKTEMKYKNIDSYRFHDEWNDNLLNKQHIHYAADDALVGYKIFIELINNMTENVTHNVMDDVLNPYISICDGLIDIKTVKKQKQKESNNGTKQNKPKKERKDTKNWVNPNQFFTNNDKFNCSKQLEIRCGNLIKFQLSPTKYKRNMNQLRDEIKTINHQQQTKEMSQCHISWHVLFADDIKEEEILENDSNETSSTKEVIGEEEKKEDRKEEEKNQGNVDNIGVYGIFYCKNKDGIFYLNSTIFDSRIYVNTAIDLKKCIGRDNELGILIKTSMGGNNIDIGSWNIGFVLGSNIFAYHPGYDKKSGGYGAARCEGINGWKTESMGFIPDTHKMQIFEIFIDRKSHIYLKIIQDENKYIRDWQHKDSLFMDDECTVFIPCCFGIRIENSKGNKHKKGKRKGRYGDIKINIAKRDITNNQISIIQD